MSEVDALLCVELRRAGPCQRSTLDRPYEDATKYLLDSLAANVRCHRTF